MHPGHPLMLAVSDIMLEQHSNLLRQGAILVDPADDGTEASLLFLLTHEIKSGDGSVLSKRLQFVRVTPDGKASLCRLGTAPRPRTTCRRRPTLARRPAGADWIRADQEQRALALAATTLVPEHLRRSRQTPHRPCGQDARRRPRTADQGNRLTGPTAGCKLKDDQEAGKDVRLNLDNVQPHRQ